MNIKIQFRKLIEDDLPFLLEVRNHISTRNMLENDQIFNINQCKTWFNESNPNWLIILNINNDRVGYVRLNNHDVGIDIHINFRKMGYAKTSYKKLLKDRNYASLWVFEDNYAINLYKSIGFIKNGNFKIIRKRKYLQMTFDR